MADISSLSSSMASPSSSSSNVPPISDDFDDACSICLEPFSLLDPSSVTNCKHEYHLHCILEWLQRSKECPICWQSLSLKDPDSQELLDVVHLERNSRRRNTPSNMSTYSRLSQEPDSEYVPRRTDGPNFDERIMQHLAAMMSQARLGHETERRASSERRPSPAIVFSSNSGDSARHPNTPEEWSSANGSSGCNSPTSSISSLDVQPALSPNPSFGNWSSGSVPKRDIHCNSRPLQSQSSDSTQSQRPSELLAFSESIKSRLNATSARYKDSISKGTQGFKEKFLARNISVKELSTGVQREMNAGIAGVARMVERLDLKLKRNSHSGEGRSRAGEASNLFTKGKGVLDNIIDNSCEKTVVTGKETASERKSQTTISVQSHKDV